MFNTFSSIYNRRTYSVFELHLQINISTLLSKSQLFPEHNASMPCPRHLCHHCHPPQLLTSHDVRWGYLLYTARLYIACFLSPPDIQRVSPVKLSP